MKYTFLAAAVSTFLLLNPVSAGAVEIGIQGRLTGSDGSPVNGSMHVEFLVYERPDSGRAVYSETRNVSFDDGYYFTGIDLGSLDLAEISSLWLAVRPEGDEEMVPRMRIFPSAFSLHSQYAARVSWSGIIDIPDGISEGLQIEDGSIDDAKISGLSPGKLLPGALPGHVEVQWESVTGAPEGDIDFIIEDGSISDSKISGLSPSKLLEGTLPGHVSVNRVSTLEADLDIGSRSVIATGSDEINLGGDVRVDGVVYAERFITPRGRPSSFDGYAVHEQQYISAGGVSLSDSFSSISAIQAPEEGIYLAGASLTFSPGDPERGVFYFRINDDSRRVAVPSAEFMQSFTISGVYSLGAGEVLSLDVSAESGDADIILGGGSFYIVRVGDRSEE